jgi:hypothetical protein
VPRKFIAIKIVLHPDHCSYDDRALENVSGRLSVYTLLSRMDLKKFPGVLAKNVDQRGQLQEA